MHRTAVAQGGFSEFLSVVLIVDFGRKAGLTIVDALNDVLRNAREVQAGKARHEFFRTERVESALDRSHRWQRSNAD
jgi:hypothetical protein